MRISQGVYVFRICISIAVMLSLCILACGCGRSTEYSEDTFISMDTVISIKLDPQTPDIKNVFARCREITEEQRKIFDADDPGSEIGIYNSMPLEDRMGTVSCSPKLASVILTAANVSFITHRAFSAGMRDTIEIWKTAEADQKLPSADVLEASVRYGYPTASASDGKTGLIGNGSRIDLGGIAKGAAEQAVIDYLNTTGARYGVLSFGGNIAVFGNKTGGEPFRVALRDPKNSAGTVGTVSLKVGFISVSGNYERYYEILGERYGHILSTSDGQPVKNDLLSVSVISDKGALADALSTALFAMGYADAKEFAEDYSEKLGFEAVFVTEDGVFATEGLSGSFTMEN